MREVREKLKKRNHYDVSRQKAVTSPQEIWCFYSIPLLDNVMDEEHNLQQSRAYEYTALPYLQQYPDMAKR